MASGDELQPALIPAELVESTQHAIWLAGVDALLATGMDPMLAIIEADPRTRQRPAST